MKTTTFSHRVLATILVAILLLITTAGFGLALSLSLKDQAPSKHVSCGCIKADDGNGESGCPASEVCQGDFNPSCCTAPIVPVYAPLVESLRIHEPFCEPPQVYLDLFVPPKSRC